MTGERSAERGGRRWYSGHVPNMHTNARGAARTLVVVAGLATVLAACGPSGAGALARSAGAGQAAPPVPPPVINVTPNDGATDVRLDAVVTVRSEGGNLDRVVLHSDADPTPLSGSLDPSGASWKSSAALDASSHYVVEATAHSASGSTSARAVFATIAAPTKLITDVQPGDGATVGVGMPIVLKFESPVAPERQADVVRHLEVQTSTPIEGAWHWFGPQEVHYRPKDFWPTQTRVTVVAHLRGVDAGGGVWGLGDWSSSFVVGNKHLSVIDAAAHQMQVFDGDQLIHTYPVSTGKPASPTISGTLVVWYKTQKVRMTSTSIGIPVNAPGGYDEDVFWDTAISLDGFYIHSAPWSVGAQGNTNVSHGCVNLSEARAIEYYNFSLVGDVVQVKNTSRQADFSDGEADWQIPFDQYGNAGGAAATPSPAPGASGGGL